jgi:hypothetical protein
MDAGTDAGPSLLHENCMRDLDASNGCSQCLHEQCCDVRLACLNDPNCAALADCESACASGQPDEAGATAMPPDGGGSYSCDLWCNAPTNPSLDKWAQLITCGTILCQGASQCGGGTTCTMCLAQHCASEDIAVSATPDGYLYDSCIGQCPSTDIACVMACQTTYPSVMAANSSFATCFQQSCPGCM